MYRQEEKPLSSNDDHSAIKVATVEEVPPVIEVDSIDGCNSSDEPGPSLNEAFGLADASPVARKIIENYFGSKNKTPGGHCLKVSKSRFEKAYKEVHGHPFYEDLPKSMATSYFSPEEVFDRLYASTSGGHQGWKSLPVTYRGKGNAGALVNANMGTLVDQRGIWDGELRPGALMQVWRYETDYKKVIHGTGDKDFDPLGHSFIFLGYERNKNGKIIGLKIADQGYQSYRPILRRDYEIWWAVNLSI